MAALEPFNRLKKCRHGQMLYNVHDMYIGRSLDLYGEFSEGEVDLFRQLIQPEQVVLEIGANIGAHTVFLAQHVGPGGYVLAFEPQRILYQTLCANAALNSLTNVYGYPQAVGSQPGEVTVPALNYRQTNNFGGVSLGGATQAGGERVGLITLDSLRLSRCDFLKINVEGMEQAVLQGAAQTIGKFRPILYVENDRQDRSAALIRAIDALGYSMYWHLPPLYNPRNFLGNAENVFGNVISMNMLCLHRDRPHQFPGLEPVPVPAG